jgi:hypothetical protein
VDHSTSLPTGLGQLTDTLDQTRIDDGLRRLGDDLAHTVDSYLGLSITITGQSGPVSLTRWRKTGSPAVGSSLLIPLRLICDGTPGSTLILYAAVPGAFVDLAADLSCAVGEPLATFVLDRHLTGHLHPNARPEFTGLTEFATINRAIGVLLACGHTWAQAHTELWNQAGGHTSRDLHTVAEAIIHSAGPGVGNNHSDLKTHDRPEHEPGSTGRPADSACLCEEDAPRGSHTPFLWNRRFAFTACSRRNRSEQTGPMATRSAEAVPPPPAQPRRGRRTHRNPRPAPPHRQHRPQRRRIVGPFEVTSVTARAIIQKMTGR